MTIPRERTEQLEREVLSTRAVLAAETKGRDREEAPDDIRTVFQRDRDRILHAKAFRRLKHKTQVFLAPQGDHYRVRLTHTLDVSQIARTCARALRLNEDLTEAIALGHDLGHTPFGHLGEQALTPFLGRPVPPQRAVPADRGAPGERRRGANLTWEVRDGIVHHPWSDADALDARGPARALRRPHRLHQPRHRRRGPRRACSTSASCPPSAWRRSARRTPTASTPS